MPTPLSDIMLNDRGFAFDPTGGETFQLSTTGLKIVRMLRQGENHDTVLLHILEEFEVDENTARRDLEDFLRALEHAGWELA